LAGPNEWQQVCNRSNPEKTGRSCGGADFSWWSSKVSRTLLPSTYGAKASDRRRRVVVRQQQRGQIPSPLNFPWRPGPPSLREYPALSGCRQAGSKYFSSCPRSGYNSYTPSLGMCAQLILHRGWSSPSKRKSCLPQVDSSAKPS
jgi:hypothetical protein